MGESTDMPVVARRDWHLSRWLQGRSRTLMALAAFAAELLHSSLPYAASLPVTGFAFTSAQASGGHAIYVQNCASCHGEGLEGGGGPPLSGSAFLDRWASGSRTARDLYDAVRQMPKQAPGSLSEGQYLDLTAYILVSNGYRPSPIPATLTALSTPLRSPAESTRRVRPTPTFVADLPTSPASVLPATQTWPKASELRDPNDADWPMYNRDYRGQRYSRLSQINQSNAAQLQPVCILQLGVLGAFESSPVIYHGIAYVTTVHDVRAFDATTCKSLWAYTYVPEDPEPALVNRGVALLDGKVFRGTADGHLLALDAATGKLLWNLHVADSHLGYFISAAPIAFDGKVIVGLAGADWGANSQVYAFDAATGNRIWKFDIIPTGLQSGAETWEKGAGTGGGSVWSTMSFDPTEGLIYVPVGNPAPDFDAALRQGANLYTDSIVVLDAKTGALAWYVQQIPGDHHDWDTAAAPVLYEQAGRKFMAVANKGGFLYIYDRITHALVAKVAVSKQENGDVALSDQPVRVCPGVTGGVEWNGPAYDPDTQALYVNSLDWCTTFKLDPKGYKAGELYLKGVIQTDPTSDARGWLQAFDADTGRPLWSYAAPAPMIAGVTPTAGGVILTGGVNGEFLVFGARDGKLLYRFNTGGGVSGGISTYMVEDRQYVAVASGNHSMYPLGTGGAPTIIVFALPANAP